MKSFRCELLKTNTSTMHKLQFTIIITTRPVKIVRQHGSRLVSSVHVNTFAGLLVVHTQTKKTAALPHKRVRNRSRQPHHTRAPNLHLSNSPVGGMKLWRAAYTRRRPRLQNNKQKHGQTCMVRGQIMQGAVCLRLFAQMVNSLAPALTKGCMIICQTLQLPDALSQTPPLKESIHTNANRIKR